MAKIVCPYCNGKSGHWSTGDGYEEWDECRCCNPDGDNDTGKLTKRQLDEFEKREAVEAEHWDRLAAEYQRNEAMLDAEYGTIIWDR